MRRMTDEEVIRAAGSGAEIGPMLRSKMTPYSSAAAYARYHARAASADKVGQGLYSQLVVANGLVYPSYVSYETALYWYELLPKGCGRVIRSACVTGRTRVLPYGAEEYAYTCQPKSYFRVGAVELPHKEPLYRIATPEKALCDLVLDTAGLRMLTRSAVCNYLVHTLQLPEDKWRFFAPGLLERCAAAAHKKQRDLEMLTLFLSELGYYEG